MPKSPQIAGLNSPLRELTVAGFSIWCAARNEALHTDTAKADHLGSRKAVIVVPTFFSASWASAFSAITQAGLPVAANKTARGKVVLTIPDAANPDETISKIANALRHQPRQMFYADIGWLESRYATQDNEVPENPPTDQNSKRSRRLRNALVMVAAVTIFCSLCVLGFQAVNTSNQTQKSERLVATSRESIQQESLRPNTFAQTDIRQLLDVGARRISGATFDVDTVLDGFLAQGLDPQVVSLIAVGGETQLEFRVSSDRGTYTARFESFDEEWHVTQLTHG